MYSNYNIDHIESDDPTDDEDSPRRKIPKWAQQGPLKRALIDQVRIKWTADPVLLLSWAVLKKCIAIGHPTRLPIFLTMK